MKKFISMMLYAGIISFSFLAYAQESLPVCSASFKNLADERGDYTELYYMIARDKVQFIEKETAFVAPYEVKLTVFNESGEEVYNVQEKRGIQAITKNQTDLFHDINDIIKFYLQPGEYSYELKLSGEGVTDVLTHKGQIISPHYSGDALQLSQIELCSNISTELTVKEFIKNNLQVYPNPSKIFDIKKPIVFFYAEIYNLEFNKDEPGSEYETSFIILDANNDTVKVYPKKKNKKAGSTSVIASYLNVRKLETGKYQLVIEVNDLTSNQLAKRSKDFFVEDVASITNKDAELFRKMITYAVNQSDLEIYDKLNLIGKQTFMKKFWKNRDPIPETIENEFKQMYIKRWNFVNTRFVNESLNEEGWQTDRGRIYLLHGPPSDIERNIGEQNMKDYEIWLYESGRYGTKRFIFADLYMRGKYYLIHSESPNQQEMYNPNWKERIKIHR